MCNSSVDWKQVFLLPEGHSPAISALMFSAGVLGNLIALALLARRWRGDSRRNGGCGGKSNSLFHVLVTELVFTDLLGTCLISPVVLVSYAQKRTLLALGACKYFAFAMTFFSLATMFMLFAMALERYLSIGHPYFYQRHVTCRAGLLVLPAIYVSSLLFCSVPLLGPGEYGPYCPGTWCFIRPESNWYLKLYSSLLLILFVAVLLCNCSVTLQLVRMHRRSRRTRCGPSLGSSRGGPGSRRRVERLSMAEEMDHLILLVLMSLTFAVCSLPLIVFVYMDKFKPSDDQWDLLSLRFLSLNSIIDPWVFAILRPPVLRLIRSVLCCRVSLRTQDATETSSSTQSNASKLTDFCGQ
ncbi:prostaglandin E2 receptor EP2 subtype [Sorex fumeus]|uniref:prostaglandin E2 receptor EP2 subtype n=1 Tax=Sorex fumeus TaxID=62283 RepID=UPI0024ADF48C|nr:prostaglandin E2 receptor EP2 subtype [Sorex fumeus]